MKMPDKVELVKKGEERYNPNTGQPERFGDLSIEMPCFIVPLGVGREFEEYGTRNRRTVSVFLSSMLLKEFDFAFLTSERLGMKQVRFEKRETISIPGRTLIRLERG